MTSFFPESWRNSPIPSWSELSSDAPRVSAVLVPFFRFPEDRYRVLFLRRSPEMTHHAGEICFPGGEREAGDDTPWSTAVREAYEEILLDPGNVAPVSLLPVVHAAVSGFDVYPVLGIIDCVAAAKNLRPNEAEIVSYCLADTEIFERTPSIRTYEYQGRTAHSPEYVLEDGCVVWGVTGKIIANVFEGLKRERTRR